MIELNNMDATEIVPDTDVETAHESNENNHLEGGIESSNLLSRFGLTQDMVAFFVMGLLNNAIYVILNANAKSLNATGIGLVYFCNIFPTLIIKLTIPYWYHLVSYNTRIWCCALFMSASLIVVAFAKTTGFKLFGVMLSSTASGLGEPTFLALSSYYDSKQVITAWSSGTGFAGVFGFAYTVFLTKVLSLSLPATLLLALTLPVLWLFTYQYILSHNPAVRDDEYAELINEAEVTPLDSSHGASINFGRSASFAERFRVFRSLYVYTIPLLTVYVSEYMMQTGTWSSIGFPIDSVHSRNNFYLAANWMYQCGVFLSRSSGTLFPLSRKALYLMPLCQLLLLIFFTVDVLVQFWWNYTLLIPCFVAGLLGGAVYVNAFCLISTEVEETYREYSLSAASVADTFGILLADIFGVLLQGCLYGANGITENNKPPDFKCGFDYSNKTHATTS